MPKRRQLRAFDLKQIEGVTGLIGVDEAGRGALAGPVVAGAVLVTREFLEGRWAVNRSGRVNDSKLLSHADRQALWKEFEELVAQGRIHAHYGTATVDEIERLNIVGATKLAMRRALEGIYPPSAFVEKAEPDLFSTEETRAAFQPTVSCRILIDGMRLRPFAYPHAGIIKGDGRSLCIAMASIIAKVVRDRLMRQIGAAHPGYGFERHMGYAVPAHRHALDEFGPTIHHRRSFAPVAAAYREAEAMAGTAGGDLLMPICHVSDLSAPSGPDLSGPSKTLYGHDVTDADARDKCRHDEARRSPGRAPD